MNNQPQRKHKDKFIYFYKVLTDRDLNLNKTLITQPQYLIHEII